MSHRVGPWSGSVHAARPRGLRSRGAAASAVLALLAMGVFASGAAAAPLGTADAFAVLGGSTVTNTGPSVIGGDVGVSPGTAVTGFPPGTVKNGTIHATDALAG